MKKTLTITAMILAVFLAGCAGKTNAALAVLEEPASAPLGGAADYPAFCVTVADGFETMDMIGGVQIYKQTGEMLQIQVDGEGMTQGDDIPILQSVNENYNGSGVREEELLGIDFHAISYTVSGVSQCMYTAVLGGKLVRIQATGESYDALPDIKKMVESVTFKI
jgi:hypothetical protein